MDISIKISLIAIVLSVFTLVRQIFIEWKHNKPQLLTYYRFAQHIEKGEKEEDSTRIPFIEIRAVNIGRKPVYIELPLICFSTGMVLHKRFEKSFDKVNYPVRLEPGQRFTTGVELIKIDSKGHFKLNKGDVLGNQPKRRFTKDKQGVSAFIEIKDTIGSTFTTDEFTITEFEEFAKHKIL